MRKRPFWPGAWASAVPLHLAGFVAAVVALMLIPGPNVALITANSVSRGFGYGLLTIAGTSSAMVVQLGLTALGMSAFLGAAGHWFGLLRWVGVAYLLYLGVMQWRQPPGAADLQGGQSVDAGRIFRRALAVSLTNPKTLFFYGAFFPQFINQNAPAGRQILLLAALFIAIAWVVDTGWAAAAHKARRWLGKAETLRNRISGAALIGAGLGLAAARVK